MRIQDGKKQRVIVSSEEIIKSQKTYGPAIKLSTGEDSEPKSLIFVHTDNLVLQEGMELLDKPGEMEFTLNDSEDSVIRDLFDVADSIMIQIDNFKEEDISLYMSNSEHMIIMKTPQGTTHLMYSNVNDVTKVTTGHFPCEMVLTEKNNEFIYNDLINIKKKLNDTYPEMLGNISVLVTI